MRKTEENYNFSEDSFFAEMYLEFLFRNKEDYTAALQEYVLDIVEY